MWMVKGECMNMGMCVCMCMRMRMREDASVGVNADASVGASTEGAGTWIRVMRGHGMSCLRAATWTCTCYTDANERRVANHKSVIGR